MPKKKKPLLDIQQVNLVEGVELDKFSTEFSDDDKSRAQAMIKKYLGQKGLDLLDAVREEPKADNGA
jgi:hypothetical protein